MEQGDWRKAIIESDHVIEGEFRIGGQEHFYMETNVSLVVPQDNDEYEAFVSSQSPTHNQVIIVEGCVIIDITHWNTY